MKQKNIFLICAFFITSVFNLAHASGAKMPSISTTDPTSTMDGTVLNPTTPNGDLGTVKGSGSTGSTTPIADKYSYLDPGHEVPQTLLARALQYFEQNQIHIPNKKIISIIDFKQHNSKERFYIINLETGNVEKYLVAHGKNSDPDFDGFATIFSNNPGSDTSSLGFYLAAETYEGNHGYSLRLDGLSNTNSNARERAIVIHPADYVNPGDKIGRSWGCPAVEPRYSAQIIDQIKDGSLIYADNKY